MLTNHMQAQVRRLAHTDAAHDNRKLAGKLGEIYLCEARAEQVKDERKCSRVG